MHASIGHNIGLRAPISKHPKAHLGIGRGAKIGKMGGIALFLSFPGGIIAFGGLNSCGRAAFFGTYCTLELLLSNHALFLFLLFPLSVHVQ